MKRHWMVEGRMGRNEDCDGRKIVMVAVWKFVRREGLFFILARGRESCGTRW